MSQGFVFIIFIILLTSLFLNVRKMVKFMMMSEAMVLKLMFFLVSGTNTSFYIVLVGLLMGVCEASMGLSLVVVLIRKNIFFMKKMF